MVNSGLLTKNDTNVLKGLAILLLLIHHLFYANNGLYDDIHLFGERFLIKEIGQISKVCVALFVMLSGYGLAIGAEKTGGVQDLKGFYLRRFKKLFLNYWLIWAVFVPVSIFAFGYTFTDAYKYDIPQQLVLDFLGLHDIFYHYPMMCYNPTWWFYSCVILLYLLFPFLYRWMKKDPLSVGLISIVISFLPIPQLLVIQFNILAFVIGMMIVSYKIPPPRPWLGTCSILILLAVERNFNSYPFMMDCLLSAAVIQLYRSANIHKYITKVLAFLGKHSMNIFLFHTFIFYFWFQDIVYASRNPIIIFFTLIAVCLPISMALEWIKKYTIYKL